MELARRLFLWSNSEVKEVWMRAVAVEMGSRDSYKVKWVRLDIVLDLGHSSQRRVNGDRRYAQLCRWENCGLHSRIPQKEQL